MQKVGKYKLASVVAANLLEFQLDADIANYVHLFWHNQSKDQNVVLILFAKLDHLSGGVESFKIALACLCNLLIRRSRFKLLARICG